MPSYRKLPSGLWQATVYKPNGKRTTETDRLKGVVKNWAEDLEARYRRGDRRDPRAGDITLGEWYQRVMSARVLDGNTITKIESLWRTHCQDEWGEWPMSSVLRLEAQQWAKDLQTKKLSRHKGVDVEDESETPALAASTIHEIVNVMTGLYTVALKEDPPIVASNPFAGLDLPTIEKPPPIYYEQDEVELICRTVEAMFGRRARLLVQIATDAGMRPGEVYGLHTDRMNWRQSLIDITRVMTRKGLREYPKSEESFRTVPARPGPIAELADELGAGRNWRGRCVCKKVGSDRPGSPCAGLVFTSPEGMPIDDGNFRDRVWYPAVDKTGLRRYPPRVWRHTGATLLVQDGVSLYTVQALLGHGDPKTTQRYAHHAPGAFEAIRGAWENR